MRKNNLGFTLLEILIALFIFSIVSMIMVSALHTVFTSQSNTARHADALSKLQITLLLMSRDFEQTSNRPITNAKNLVDPPFMGSPNMVTFTHAGFANPLGGLQRSTLQRTQYSLDNEHLIRSIWPVLDQTQKTFPSNRVLLRGITSLRFDYLDSQNKFHDNWPAPDQKQIVFPRAVRVSMTLKNWGTLTQLFLLPQTQKAPEKKSNDQPDSNKPSAPSSPASSMSIGLPNRAN